MKDNNLWAWVGFAGLLTFLIGLATVSAGGLWLMMIGAVLCIPVFDGWK